MYMRQVAARLKPVILLEFNELCPSLLNKWMDSGDLPNFKNFYDHSASFITNVDVDDPKYLEPWVQWYSMHTGISYEEHGVLNLTDGPRANHPDLWCILSNAGFPVMSGGSMNARQFSGDDNVFLSDPWCDTQDAWPNALNTYQNFIAKQVQEHSNATNPLTLGDTFRFGAFMLGHGLSWASIYGIAKQLADETLKDHRLNYRRVAALDLLQFDVFKHYYRKHHPQFATLFSNSVAHLQHSFWRHMEPDAFQNKPSEEDIQVFGDAIKFGYKAVDQLLGRIINAFGDEAILIFATALSQKPFEKYEAQGGQYFYRPHNIEQLLKTLGISYQHVEPVMTHQYMLHCKDENEMLEAERKLQACSVENKTVFATRHKGGTDLYFGSQISMQVNDDAPFKGPDNEWSDFSSHFYLIDHSKSGCHHPDGALWIRTGQARRLEKEDTSILDVAPTILDLLGQRGLQPAHWTGKSLAPRLS